MQKMYLKCCTFPHPHTLPFHFDKNVALMMFLEKNFLHLQKESAIQLRFLINGVYLATQYKMSQQFVPVRFYDTQSKTNHYDVLKITPKASNSQIKKSYYKLSMLYHPDQNKGNEEASVKFREITEAYEVLSNIHKRRLYDKGLLGYSSTFAAGEAEAYSKSVHSAKSGSKSVPTSGHTPLYNFDEWSRIHYQGALGKKYNAKVRNEHKMQRNIDISGRKSRTITLYIILVSVISMGFSYSTYFDEDIVRGSSDL